MGSAGRFEDLPAWALELVERERVGRLGFLDADDRPRVLPVTYALAGGSLWTAVDSKPKRGQPARVRYLRRRPHAALTVDRYDDDWSRLAWVQVLADADLLDAGDPAAAAALDALAAKYQPYRDEPPPGPVVKLVPTRALWWRAAGGAR